MITLKDLGIDLESADLVHARKEVLYKKCRPVPLDLDPSDLRKLVDLMGEVMEKMGGVGLAANQIGVDLAVVVTSLDGLEVLINPEVTYRCGMTVNSTEGCLSLGKKVYVVKRPMSIRLQYEDLMSREIIRKQISGPKVKVLMHETDHVNGLTIENVGKFHAGKTKIQIQYELVENAIREREASKIGLQTVQDRETDLGITL